MAAGGEGEDWGGEGGSRYGGGGKLWVDKLQEAEGSVGEQGKEVGRGEGGGGGGSRSEGGEGEVMLGDDGLTDSLLDGEHV